MKVYFTCTYRWRTMGIISFNILPTIEFYRDNINDDIGDYGFDVSFRWLFWTLTFSKYWEKKRGRL